LYFDPLPKKNIKDLFNRKQELDTFQKALGYSRLIAIVGPRRTGKTSFMNVALAESGQPHVTLDLRGLPFNPSQADIVKKVESAFNGISKTWLTGIAGALRQVKGVSILGNSVSLDWSNKGTDLPDLLDGVDRWAGENGNRFIMAFDEIQVIRGEKSIPRLLAHVADYDQHVRLVVTGSEVGLLFDFLGFDDPESPLYGRHYTQINMQNFGAEESAMYLREGFKQLGLPPGEGVPEYAVGRLDGNVGWLTLFGTLCRDENEASTRIVDRVVAEGGKLSRSEALKLARYSPRYAVVLNHLARAGSATWTQLKSVLEAHEGRSLPSSTVSETLSKLVKTSIIDNEEGYHIPDPLLVSGVLSDPLPES
jgi:AAA+ ATPase superfamily predicted ATPase